MLTNKPRFCRIGIAGYMGSGKSTVSRLLKDTGMHVFDADVLAKELMQTDKTIWHKLTLAYETSTFITEHGIDFKALGKVAFSSIEHVKLLNAIVHKELVLHLQVLLVKCEMPWILDAALIPLWHIESWFDKCLWVDASREIRCKRILAKNVLSEEQIVKRMSIQESLLMQPNTAVWSIIDNNGPIQEVQKQVLQAVYQCTEF